MSAVELAHHVDGELHSGRVDEPEVRAVEEEAVVVAPVDEGRQVSRRREGNPLDRGISREAIGAGSRPALPRRRYVGHHLSGVV